MREIHGIKPQDILLLMKMLVSSNLPQKDLAFMLKISTAEVSHGLKRLKLSGLINSENKPILEACVEFIIHGLKYVFPAELGTLSAGIPTAHSKPGFNFVKQNKDQIYVWPYAEGTVRGISIKPIHPSFPEACKNDKKLYVIASLAEMVRAGRARERNIAADKLTKLILEAD